MDETIADFDFVLDDQEDLHVAWVAERRVRGRAGFHLGGVWYACTEDQGRRWRPPVLLDTVATGPVCLLASGSRLDLLHGIELQHRVSPDRGRSWLSLPQVVPDEAGLVRVVEMASLGDRVLAAFTTENWLGKDSERLPHPRTNLYVCHRGTSSFLPPMLLHQFDRAHITHPSLSLTRSMDELTLVMSAGELVVDTLSERVERFRSRGRLFSFQSVHSGRRWTMVDLLSGQGDSVPIGNEVHSIEDVAYAEVRGVPTVLFTSFGVHCMFRIDGRWTKPTQLAVYDAGLRGSNEAKSVQVTPTGESGWLVWIDERHQATDRTLLLPLGGFPWSDQPEWRNNDVFAVPLRKIGPKRTLSHIRPERLTGHLSVARKVKLRVANGTAYTMWAGSEKLGKRKDVYGKAKLFWCQLPAE